MRRKPAKASRQILLSLTSVNEAGMLNDDTTSPSISGVTGSFLTFGRTKAL